MTQKPKGMRVKSNKSKCFVLAVMETSSGGRCRPSRWSRKLFFLSGLRHTRVVLGHPYYTAPWRNSTRNRRHKDATCPPSFWKIYAVKMHNCSRTRERRPIATSSGTPIFMVQPLKFAAFGGPCVRTCWVMMCLKGASCVGGYASCGNRCNKCLKTQLGAIGMQDACSYTG